MPAIVEMFEGEQDTKTDKRTALPMAVVDKPKDLAKPDGRSQR